jgi:hypothetical protein
VHGSVPSVADTPGRYIASTPQAMMSPRACRLVPGPDGPLGHLPYPEEVAAARAKAESQRRHSSVLIAQSPSLASTPLPLTPVQQTLTFITYPKTEPRAYCHDRRGGEADSDDPWDGWRGLGVPENTVQEGPAPRVACFFCRPQDRVPSQE